MWSVQIFIIIISSSSSISPELADPLKGVGATDVLFDHVGHHVSGVHLYDNEGRQCHAADLGDVLTHQGSQVIQLLQQDLVSAEKREKYQHVQIPH